jgi:hypothetical protein
MNKKKNLFHLNLFDLLSKKGNAETDKAFVGEKKGEKVILSKAEEKLTRICSQGDFDQHSMKDYRLKDAKSTMENNIYLNLETLKKFS